MLDWAEKLIIWQWCDDDVTFHREKNFLKKEDKEGDELYYYE